MCDKGFSKYSFTLKYCLHGFKTQEMCDKAVDSFLPTLKFVPYWFVSNEIIKKVYSALFTDNDNSFLMKILGMSHFQEKIWVLLL